MKNILPVIIWSILLGFLIGYFCPLGRKPKPQATFDNDISWFPEEPIEITNTGIGDVIEITFLSDPNAILEVVECARCPDSKDGEVIICPHNEKERKGQ